MIREKTNQVHVILLTAAWFFVVFIFRESEET